MLANINSGSGEVVNFQEVIKSAVINVVNGVWSAKPFDELKSYKDKEHVDED